MIASPTTGHHPALKRCDPASETLGRLGFSDKAVSAGGRKIATDHGVRCGCAKVQINDLFTLKVVSLF